MVPGATVSGLSCLLPDGFGAGDGAGDLDAPAGRAGLEDGVHDVEDVVGEVAAGAG